MIVVEFTGGLGNQLFSYAAGRALALRRSTALLADPIGYCYRPGAGVRIVHRDFELASWALPLSIRSARVDGWRQVRGYRRLRSLLLDGWRRGYHCDGRWTPQFDRLPGNSVLHGYFQDRRYFAAESATVVAELRAALARRVDELGVADEPAADGVLHLRFGDYLAHPEFHPERVDGYARRALRWLAEEAGCRSIRVYSDDPGRAAAMTSTSAIPADVAPVDPRGGGVVDLWRMSRARALAIANSTYSWWAATLSTSGFIAAPAWWSVWCTDPQETLYAADWRTLGDSSA